jgi:transposase
VSVVCDLIGKRVPSATPGKDTATWSAFAWALEAHNDHPRAITEVSIDLSPTYIAGARENLGDQAFVVFDMFHVIMHANFGADETRRAERAQAEAPPVNSSSRRAGSCSRILRTTRRSRRSATPGCCQAIWRASKRTGCG